MKSTPAEVAALFGVDVRDNFPPRYNICPTQPVAVIRQNERRRREYGLARWGFVPSWAKGEFLQNLASRPMLHARGETVLEKASFRSAFKRRRCLIPADGFYEWKTDESPRQPYAVRRTDEALFAFAGVWETAVDPDGGEIDTLAILTASAGPDLSHLHHREPVVISPDHFALWLEADERDAEMIAELLHAAPARTWDAYPVSAAVNSARRDGPDLLAPLAA